MTFPDVAYLRWAKAQPPVEINLARSGLPACPPSLLGLRAADLVTSLPVKDGYRPLLEALARRYRVSRDDVFYVSGGTGMATFVAAAAALHGAEGRPEVIVERPAYEPLLRIPEALGARVRRLDRTLADGFAIDIDHFRAMVTTRTRLAIVSHLHNPSGRGIDAATLAAMARALRRVGGYLLVDEVYAECQWGRRTTSAVHLGRNVITTNSLTKAYGLDGLRAGWLLGPAAIIDRARRIQDLLENNSVASGEQMTLAALRHLPAIRRRAQSWLGPNLAVVRDYLASERRLTAVVPDGGTVFWARLPRGLDGDRFAARLLRRYDTLVVPGRFFEASGFIRVSFGLDSGRLRDGLGRLSRALPD